jgi:hypothetical protein
VVTNSAGSSHEAGVQEGDLLLAVAGQHIPKSEQGMQAAAQSMIDGAAQPLLMRFKRLAESTSGEAVGVATRLSKMIAVADEHAAPETTNPPAPSQPPPPPPPRLPSPAQFARAQMNTTVEERRRQEMSPVSASAIEYGGVSRDLAESTSREADGNSHVMNVSPEQGVLNRNRRHLVASNPVNIDEIETRLSIMRAVADFYDDASRDLAENEADLTSSNVSVVVTQCDI